jgi:hypothetical protein
MSNFAFGDNVIAQIAMRKAGGSEASPTAVVSGMEIGRYNFSGYNGSAFKSQAYVTSFATENWSTSAMGQNLDFKVCGNGTGYPVSALTLDRRFSATFNGAMKNNNFVGNKVLVTSGTQIVEASLDKSKLAYLANVTSDIQSQINTEVSESTSSRNTVTAFSWRNNDRIAKRSPRSNCSVGL